MQIRFRKIKSWKYGFLFGITSRTISPLDMHLYLVLKMWGFS